MSFAPTPLPRRPSLMSRSMQLALFATGLLWLLAAHAIAVRSGLGIAVRFRWSNGADLLSDVFLLFLLLVGFTVLNWIGTREGSVSEANALPLRSTLDQEWTRGAVIGWAALLIAVLPMMLFGSLHPQFNWTASAFGATILSIVSIAVAALVNEVAFRGFLFRRLIGATGPTAAALVLSGIYALLGSLRPNATTLSFFITFIAGALFSVAYLRTRALWLGWGLHFAWAAATAILFGLPVAGDVSYQSVVQTGVSGPAWFTGGAYGPEGAFFTGIVLFVAMAFVYSATRDYAWNYAQPVIVPGGYPMDIPPPAAHTAMEQQQAAARPQPLVQIAPAPPNGNGAASSSPREPALQDPSPQGPSRPL